MKILSYVTHTPHQYDVANALYDSEMTLLNTEWHHSMRPAPKNINFLPPQNVNPKDYDVFISHCGGDASPDFLQFSANLPHISICHGGPEPFMFPKGQPERIVRKLKKIDAVVHCNEKEMIAWRRHGKLDNQRYIWHGMKESDFKQCDYLQKRAIIVNSGGWPPMNNLKMIERLHQAGIPWLQRDFNVKSFSDYVSILSQFSVYISVTRSSSFPRSRAEAMHSGLCVITTNNWDEDKFIEDGVNGFFVGNNSEEILNLYENLDRSMVEVVGKAGQETAKKVFGLKKYRKAWLKVIKDVT
jgi:hypothetical protein